MLVSLLASIEEQIDKDNLNIDMATARPTRKGDLGLRHPRLAWPILRSLQAIRLLGELAHLGPPATFMVLPGGAVGEMNRWGA